MMRLQKFLAHAGVCSRRKAEEYISQGRVAVNKKIVTLPGTQVDPLLDKVFFDNKPVLYQTEQQGQNIYIALNKPRGVVTSCSSCRGEAIVLDFIKIDRRIYPVGRLDKDSQGLLLLTNDGDLHNRLSHPSFNHEKEYIVTTQSPVGDQDLDRMAGGMVLDGKKTRKARVTRIAANSFSIVLKQGLNRQIRRMVGMIGNKVNILKRTRMGAIKLGGLKEGRWRHLSSAETAALKKNN